MVIKWNYMRLLQVVWIIIFGFIPLAVFAEQQPLTLPPYLSFLHDPNLAYLLLLFAVYGIFFEVANPGMIVPGIVGFLCLILSLYALFAMPVDYTALTLLLIGLVFMIFEGFVSSFGVVAFFGLLAFVLGSMTLFDSKDYKVSWYLIFGMGLASAAFFFIIVNIAIRAYKRAVVTGKEGLIGKHGKVIILTDKQMKVRVLGEIWDADSKEKLVLDQPIKVIGIRGLKLRVEPLQNP